MVTEPRAGDEGVRDDHYFAPVEGGPDFDNETPTTYLARMAKQGHWCCQCPLQTPPLPCCNAGHAEAVEALREARRIERAQ